MQTASTKCPRWASPLRGNSFLTPPGSSRHHRKRCSGRRQVEHLTSGMLQGSLKQRQVAAKIQQDPATALRRWGFLKICSTLCSSRDDAGQRLLEKIPHGKQHCAATTPHRHQLPEVKDTEHCLRVGVNKGLVSPSAGPSRPA